MQDAGTFAKREDSNPLPIYAFAESHQLTLIVEERDVPRRHPARYYAYFANCFLSDPPLLKTVYGNGQSREEAINHLAAEIERKTIVHHDELDRRRDSLHRGPF
jgi:hypothetical protein